jgi:glycosyltransferase involved in cell wall biosynthesis
MRILHTVPGMNLYSGGPTHSTFNLVKGLLINNVQAFILTLVSKYNTKSLPEENFIKIAGKPINNRFGYSRFFKKSLKEYAFVDIVHVHGLWQYPSHASLNYAFKNNIPAVISPRGMLYPDALKKSKYLKKISLFLYQYNDLKKAKIIHVTCQQEKNHIRKLGINLPIAVIPNPIEIREKTLSNNSVIKRRVGFIGRLDPIKNIEDLLRAWAISGKEKKDWELVLIGDGSSNYKNSLIRLAKELGIKNIHWVGYLAGKDKEDVFSTFHFLVLPSISENFGMVVAESLQNQIPVIASKGTPWEELNTYNAGWWIDLGVDSLVNAIREAMKLTDNERTDMGKNGRKLVEQNYSIEVVTKKMIALYKWILEGGNKPEFVEIT